MGDQEKVPQDRRRPRDGFAGKGGHPCMLPACVGRPRAVKRAGGPELPHRRAGLEKAARWHELVEAHERAGIGQAFTCRPQAHKTS